MDTIYLTAEQVQEITAISERYGLGVELEETNIQGVVLLRYRTDTTRTQMEQVLINENGFNMAI